LRFDTTGLPSILMIEIDKDPGEPGFSNLRRRMRRLGGRPFVEIPAGPGRPAFAARRPDKSGLKTARSADR